MPGWDSTRVLQSRTDIIVLFFIIAYVEITLRWANSEYTEIKLLSKRKMAHTGGFEPTKAKPTGYRVFPHKREDFKPSVVDDLTTCAKKIR